MYDQDGIHRPEATAQFEPTTAYQIPYANLTPSTPFVPARSITWENPWRGVDVLLVGLGVLFSIVVGGGLTYLFLSDIVTEARHPGVGDWFPETTATTVAFVLSGFMTLMMIGLRGRSFGDLGFRAPSVPWVLAAIALGVAFIPIRIMLILVISLALGITATEEGDDSFAASPSAEDPYLWLGLAQLLVIVVVLAPIVEEIVFRGVLHRWLEKRIGLVVAVLVSSVIFGAAHLGPFIAVSNTVLGMVLALSFHYSRSIYVPMLIHFVNNLLVVLMLIALVLLAGFATL